MKQLLTAVAVISTLMLGCKKDKKSVASISTTAPSSLTSTGFVTGGNITDDGGSAISKRGVAWATHAGPTVADSITSDGTGEGTFITTLANLNANTTYYVRAYAINASGTAYGNEVSVKTSTGVASITTTAISNIQPLSAMSGGEITNDGGAAITERGVVYSTTSNPTITGNKIVAGSGTGSFTATLSPLASNQTYYVRAYATNSFGTAYGNQVQFNAASANTVTDLDGNVYPYVSICGKDWFATNLKTTKYKNGDVITNGWGTPNFNWLANTTGAYTFPDSVQANNALYGKLYNLEAVRDTRGICPTGWHIATDLDWQAAEVCQGMDPAVASTNGDRCCVGLKFLTGGSSGLEIRRAGNMTVVQSNGATQFSGFGTTATSVGWYWTSTVSTVGPTLNRYRLFNFFGSLDNIYRQSGDRSFVLSARCVRD